MLINRDGDVVIAVVIVVVTVVVVIEMETIVGVAWRSVGRCN